MKVFIRAQPNSKNEKIEKADETHFTIAVKEPPKNGRANEAIAKVLAEYLGVNRLRVRLISGSSSKRKAFEIR